MDPSLIQGARLIPATPSRLAGEWRPSSQSSCTLVLALDGSAEPSGDCGDMDTVRRWSLDPDRPYAVSLTGPDEALSWRGGLTGPDCLQGRSAAAARVNFERQAGACG